MGFPGQADFALELSAVQDLVYGLSLRLTRNSQAAEDLMQEAALRAFRGFHQFHAGTNFKAWFLKILVNTFHQLYRKERRQVSTVGIDTVTERFLYPQIVAAGMHVGHQDPAAAFLSRLSVRQLESAFAALPDDFQVVTVLYFLEELTYSQIAEIMDCPIGTVRSRLHRGRRLLQEALWQLAAEAGIDVPRAGEDQ